MESFERKGDYCVSLWFSWETWTCINRFCMGIHTSECLLVHCFWIHFLSRCCEINHLWHKITKHTTGHQCKLILAKNDFIQARLTRGIFYVHSMFLKPTSSQCGALYRKRQVNPNPEYLIVTIGLADDDNDVQCYFLGQKGNSPEFTWMYFSFSPLGSGIVWWCRLLNRERCSCLYYGCVII